MSSTEAFWTVLVVVAGALFMAGVAIVSAQTNGWGAPPVLITIAIALGLLGLVPFIKPTEP